MSWQTNSQSREDVVLRIKLTHKRYGTKEVLIDAEDYALIEPYSWYLMHGKGDCWYVKGYKRGASRKDPLSRRDVLIHRLILSAPRGMEVDHINGNGLDNRRCNLRLATRAQNAQNRRRQDGKTRGVFWDKRAERWRAKARLANKHYHIGYFDTEQEAAEAVSEWRQLHMPFSNETSK